MSGRILPGNKIPIIAWRVPSPADTTTLRQVRYLSSERNTPYLGSIILDIYVAFTHRKETQGPSSWGGDQSTRLEARPYLGGTGSLFVKRLGFARDAFIGKTSGPQGLLAC